jgi:hypothetical protein
MHQIVHNLDAYFRGLILQELLKHLAVASHEALHLVHYMLNHVHLGCPRYGVMVH